MKNKGDADPPKPRLIRVKAGAKYLGMSPWSLRGLIQSGDLRVIRLGNTFLLDVRDLDQYIESHKVYA